MKSDSKRLKKMLLKWIGVSCIIVLAATVFCTLYLAYIRNELRAGIEHNVFEIVEQNSGTVTQKIEYVVKSLDKVSSMVTIYYTKYDKNEIKGYLLEYLENERSSNEYLQLGIVTGKGNCYASDGNVYKIEPGDGVQAVLNGKSILLGYSSGTGFSESGVVVGVPVYNGENIIEACLYAIIDIETVGFSETASFLDGRGYTYISDLKHNVIIPFSAEMTEGHSGLIYEAEVTDYIFKSGQQSIMDDMAEQLFDTGRAMGRLKISEEEAVYVGLIQIEGYDNYISVSVIKEDVVDAGIRRVALISRIICILIVLLAFMICAYVCRTNYINYRKVYELETYDKTTGLYGRKRHEEIIDERLQEKPGAYSYVIMEIENFDFIGEMFGSENAEKILIVVAEVIRKLIKQQETIARVSDSEFAFLLETTDRNFIRNRIREIANNAASEANDKVGGIGTLLFQVGVYACESDGKHAYNCAMSAKNTNKEASGDYISFFDQAAESRIREERELEQHMNEALINKEFVVYLQPKYSIADEKPVGAEALVRWLHPEKGIIRPDLFIPLFERNGFIIPLDMYVLDEICRKLRVWIDKGYDVFPVSVNLSRVQFRKKGLVERMTSIVDKYGLDHRLIEFEITETAAVTEANEITKIVGELKSTGFVTSMDDFGSGYSSLNMLKEISVDVLKLDKDFMKYVDSTGDEEKNHKIIAHIIEMAKDLNMHVLAEGVETLEQKELLKQFNCDMVQGYYYAKPMPAEVFEQEYYRDVN